jgi:hypothetical protein
MLFCVMNECNHRVAFVRGGICPGGFMSGVVSVRVVFVWVVFVRGGLCTYNGKMPTGQMLTTTNAHWTHRL